MVQLITPQIVSDLPLGNASGSQFHFESYANTLARTMLWKRTKTPLVVGVSGRWGTGKTTLLQILKSKLDERAPTIKAKEAKTSFLTAEEAGQYRTCKTVWFNAWKYSRADDLHVSLVKQISREMWQDGNLKDRIAAKAKELAGSYKWGTAFLDVVSQVASKGSVSLKLDDYEKISPVQQHIVLLDEFQTFFDALVAEFTRRDNDGILVVLIDDLDRCLPSKIVEVLEAIKAFVDTCGCIFVVGADSDVVTASVRAHYVEHGMDRIDPKEYLEKLVQVRFDLPPLRVGDAAQFVGNVLGASTPSGKLVRLLVQSIPTNPRRIKMFLNHIELQWSIMINTGYAKKASKEHLIQWLVLCEASPALAEQVKTTESDPARAALIDRVRRCAMGDKSIEKSDPRVAPFVADATLTKVLRQGAFDFPRDTIGLYIHLSPAPSLRLPSETPEALVDDVLETLTPRETKAVRLRFGLADGRVWSCAQIAGELGVSETTVRRTIAKSLRKVRHPTRSRMLRELLGGDRSLAPDYERYLRVIFGEASPSG